MIGRLRACRYDLSVSIAGDWASVLAWLSGARRRVGYEREAYPGLLTDPVPGGRYGVRQHEVEYVKQLARVAGGRVADDVAPALHATPEGERRALQLLAQCGVTDLGGPLVALHAGARNGLAKRWPTVSWAQLATDLVERLGARVVLVGAGGDLAIAAELQRLAQGRVIDLTGQTTLADLVALLALCDLVISGDSGPLHIACAVGTPVVGIYGPTDPLISGPLGTDALVVRQPIWCAPCYDARATADCRFRNPVCMKALPHTAVVAAARRQLAKRRRSDARTIQGTAVEHYVASIIARDLPTN